MKKTSRLIIFCLLLLAASTIRAKDDNKPTGKEIVVTGGNFSHANAIFVSEIHGFYELSSFKMALIGYLQQNSNIRHVILEIGHSSAYLINRYLQKGEENIAASSRTKNVYEALKKLYAKHPFTVHGIDFERMEFVTATKYILADNMGAEKSALYKYINSIADTAGKIPSDANGYNARTYFYDQACTLFSQEKESLRVVVKTDFNVLERIFENPASEQQMKKRNKSMYANLAALQAQLKEGFVCMLGGSHNMLGSSQSLLSRYLSDNPGNIVLIKMLCSNCYTTSYFNTNVLTPFAHDPDDTKAQITELAAGFDSFYNRNNYQLVNERCLLKELPEHKKTVLVYYALFKDQPQW